MAMSKALRSVTRSIPRFVLSRSMMTRDDEACRRFARLGFKEPAGPIICELALAIEQNPISAFVMGMWMGYVNDEGAFFNFDNTNPTRYDLLRARSDLDVLSADQMAKLKTIWPRKYGKVKPDYLSHEYAHYSLTAFGVHKPCYFLDAMTLAGPYMAGGSKDLASFITKTFEVGKKYPIAHVEGAMSERVSAEVALRLEGTKNDVRLSGITIAYLEDRSRPGRFLVLRNHPPVVRIGDVSDIIVH